MEKRAVNIVLGVGSNSPKKEYFIRQSVQRLKRSHPDIRVLKISPIYESDALLPENAPDSWNQPFLNLALLAETSLSLSDLGAELKRIEKNLGRTSRDRWAPRDIDIDLLAYGEECMSEGDMTVPHPGNLNRPFASLPMADVWPDWRIPEGLQSPNSAKTLSEFCELWRQWPTDRVPFRTRRSSTYLTQFVGILNVTPDSFSDGGRYLNPKAAYEKIKAMAQAGVDVIDIGAESTRPGGQSISVVEEWDRLNPVLALVQDIRKELPFEFQLSVDTRNAATAEMAIELGADWINDVTAGEDPQMLSIISKSEAKYVIMHHCSIPVKRDQHLDFNQNALTQVTSWFEKKINEVEQSGIHRNRIILDPGIGFGKTAEQSWQIVRNPNFLNAFGCEVLFGASRKSFMNRVTDQPFSERDLESRAVCQYLASSSIEYLRVHDIEGTLRQMRVWNELDGVQSL